jgi:hypothetical protein
MVKARTEHVRVVMQFLLRRTICTKMNLFYKPKAGIVFLN